MVKMIALDMDGTLLTSDQKITARTQQAVKQALGEGVQVVIATGRAFYEAYAAVKSYDLNLPYICLNGAQVRNEQHEIITTASLNRALIDEISSIFKAEDVFYQVYTDRAIYSTDLERDIEIFLDLSRQSGGEVDEKLIRERMEERVARKSMIEIADYKELFNREDETVLKFLGTSTNKAKLVRAKNYLYEVGNLAVSASHAGNIELTHENAQKGIALQNMAETLEIDMKDVMAVGDNLNDTSMLKRAGLAVAMGNASAEVKAIADVVTERNQDDGVAIAIERALSGEFENEKTVE
jgi:Cof subfamily protein (haloacid dehalogenase superfamily)